MASLARTAAVSLILFFALSLITLLVARGPLLASNVSSLGFSPLRSALVPPSLSQAISIPSSIASYFSPSLLPLSPPAISSHAAAAAAPSVDGSLPRHATIRDSPESPYRRPSPSRGVGDASAILPEYLGHVTTGGEGLAWGGSCFELVTARLALARRAERVGLRTGPVAEPTRRGEDSAGKRRSVRDESWGGGQAASGGMRARRRGTRGTGGEREWVVAMQEEVEAEVEVGNGARADGRASGQAAVTVTLSPRHKQHVLCSDVYALATPFHLVVRLLPLALRQTIEWPPMGPLETDYVKQRGIAVFRLPHGLWPALKALLQLLPLASDSSVGEAAQMRFLHQHMNASFRPHVPLAPLPDLTLPFAAAFLSSGDLLLTSKFRGPWGLFETIEKWVTGSYAAHAAVLLRAQRAGAGGGAGAQWVDVGSKGQGVGERGSEGEGGEGEGEEGELWVAESGRISVAGRPEIAVERFADWWRRQQSDRSGQHVVVLPLGREGRWRWDNGRAWRFVRGMEGRQFGYHNIVFSWIDTAGSNFPPPINENTVAALAAVWSRVQPEYAARIWNEALNRRLGTQNLSLEQVLVECQRRNISFGQLLAVPEQDNWRYSDGLSLSCVAFALRVWKEAGVFGDMGDAINVSEFTIRDAYQLQVFASNASHLPAWCFSQEHTKQDGEIHRGRDSRAGREMSDGECGSEQDGEAASGARTWCQLLGKWRFDLPGFNSIPLYAHMNERCPSLPPQYTRPSFC
ncbi:hypothetical protein CLOP_g21976 [Closterium sp. NIES-67]|nr:hypothetical protein CLOP_g21976 [Closterium sp. NIES-67]